MEEVDAEVDESSFHVVLEFPGYEHGFNFFLDKKNYSIVGLETDTPLLQVDNLLFQGHYEEFIGTAICFPLSGAATPPPTTTKKLVFTSVVVQPKSTPQPSPSAGSTTTID